MIGHRSSHTFYEENWDRSHPSTSALNKWPGFVLVISNKNCKKTRDQPWVGDWCNRLANEKHQRPVWFGLKLRFPFSLSSSSSQFYFCWIQPLNGAVNLEYGTIFYHFSGGVRLVCFISMFLLKFTSQHLSVNALFCPDKDNFKLPMRNGEWEMYYLVLMSCFVHKALVTLLGSWDVWVRYILPHLY